MRAKVIGVQERSDLVRDALVQLLSGLEGVVLAGAVRSGPDLVDLCQRCRADVVVLEVDVTDWDVGAILQKLRAQRPRPRLLGFIDVPFGVYSERETALELDAVMTRDMGIEAIMEALGLGTTESPHPMSPGRSVRPGTLTRRQQDVLAGIGSGWTSHEIAQRLGITRKTVENHKQRIFVKLGVQNQSQAVSVALRSGALMLEYLDRVTGAGTRPDRS